MVRAGNSSSSGGGAGGGGGGVGGTGARWRGRSWQRSRRRQLSDMKKVECFSPVLCHCKVACTNSTISLMFGCKVGGHIHSEVTVRSQPAPGGARVIKPVRLSELRLITVIDRS